MSGNCLNGTDDRGRVGEGKKGRRGEWEKKSGRRGEGENVRMGLQKS